MIKTKIQKSFLAIVPLWGRTGLPASMLSVQWFSAAVLTPQLTVASASPCGISSHWGLSVPMAPCSSAFTHSHGAPVAQQWSQSQVRHISRIRYLTLFPSLLFLVLPLCHTLPPEMESLSTQNPEWGSLTVSNGSGLSLQVQVRVRTE